MPPMVRWVAKNEGDHRFKQWIKHVTAVDKTQKGGYALEGEFLSAGREYDLPVEAVIVRYHEEGSHAHHSGEADVYTLQADGEKAHHGTFSWHSELLTMRDMIADLVASSGSQTAERSSDALTTFTDEQLIAEAKRRGLTLPREEECASR